MSSEHDDAVGIWQLQETQQVPDAGDGRLTNNHYTFRYDEDGTVTVRLVTMHDAMWKSPDDFYRLDARWDGDMLSYRPPFGDWTELAAFTGGHFEDAGGGVRRVFGRVDPGDVADFNRAILAPRERHDYGIAPTDGPVGPPSD